MAFINGIGGAFLFSHRPKQLADWYNTYLGLQFEAGDVYNSVYRTFLSGSDEIKNCEMITRFFIIKAQRRFSTQIPVDEPDLMYGDQPFMISFRAEDLSQLVAKINDLGVRIIKEQEEDHGHFVWLRDLDGNRVELYEPYPEKENNEEEEKEEEQDKKPKSKSDAKSKASKKKAKKS
ncbi:MAG TPA: VOC family protein [Balneolales bacterium]|nr:VOC family protein [Balneolales bacterium]